MGSTSVFLFIVCYKNKSHSKVGIRPISIKISASCQLVHMIMTNTNKQKNICSVYPCDLKRSYGNILYSPFHFMMLCS